MSAAVISSKGQVVIPAPLRAALHLVEGDRVTFTLDGQRLIVERELTRDERCDRWLAEAFADYVQDAPEKVWTELDSEDFVDG